MHSSSAALEPRAVRAWTVGRIVHVEVTDGRHIAIYQIDPSVQDCSSRSLIRPDVVISDQLSLARAERRTYTGSQEAR